jgi:digeranylgeranylglycerophospholipid reductase
MKRIYDVIVIGAGGAGLMMARNLGDLKHKVLLIDRKKDLLNLPFKTLGSFIDIKEFDLSPNVIASNINKATIYSKNFSCSGNGNASILDKEKLHSELLNKIDTNYVDILKSTTIVSHESENDGNITVIKDNQGNKYSAKYFVDSTGIAGIFSKKSGLQDKTTKLAVGLEYNVKYCGNPHEAHFYIGKDFQGGYGWIFPLKNQRAIIGFGSFENLVIKEIKKRLNNMLTIEKIANLVEKDNDLAEGGSIPITDVKSKFVQGNLICVGDSVSQVNPIVGEGYRYIFKSASLASKAIDKAIRYDDDAYLKEYEVKWSKEFKNKYRIAKKLQITLDKFSKNDLLIDLGVLFLKTKRHKTVEKLFAGEFTKRDLLLP